MSNIVFTDTGKSVLVDFGDKSEKYGAKQIEVPKNSSPLIVEEDNVHVSFYSDGDKMVIDYNHVDTPSSTDATDLKDKISPFFFNLAKIKLADFAFGGIYSTSSSSFASIPLQVLASKPADVSGTSVKAKLAIDYLLDTGVTGEIELYNYTDLAVVAGSQFTISTVGAWTYGIGPEVTLTEGKSYRIRSRRSAGQGNNKVYIEAGQLILIYG